MSTVAVIPARGGSVGIPRKNLALLNGRPLIEYTFDAALGSKRIDRTLLSTDDDEIAAVGRARGIEVPFLRDMSLSAAETPMLPVLLDALDRAAPEATVVVLLQPTSPLRRAEHIDEALALLDRSAASAVVSIVAVPHAFTPGSQLERDAAGLVVPLDPAGPQRRQDKPSLFARNGPAIYAARIAELRARGDLYGGATVGYTMGSLDSVDVDAPDDLLLCEFILANR